MDKRQDFLQDLDKLCGQFVDSITTFNAVIDDIKDESLISQAITDYNDKVKLFITDLEFLYTE